MEAMMRSLLVVLATTAVAVLPASRSQADTFPNFPSLYQSRVRADCLASTQCTAQFARVPPNRFLQATNLNCFGLASNNQQVTFVLFTGSLDADPETFDYFHVDSMSDHFRFTTNETILSFFRAGERPKILLAADVSSGMQLFCKLTGTLLTR